MLHIVSTFLYQTIRRLGKAYLVELPKVSSQIPLGLDIKVLLSSEKDNASVSDQSSKIVLLRVGEICEIDAVNLGADFGIVIKDCGGILQ